MRKELTLIVLLIALLSLAGCGHEHTFTEATCTQLATCTECGATEGELAPHKWIEASCAHLATCRVCDETKGELLPHSWLDATCTEPQRCSVCNATQGEPIEHTWSEATCDKPAKCVNCGEIGTKAKGHVWEGTTCTEAGYCTVCGATGVAKGHSWEAATCTHPKRCKTCEIEEGDKKPHTVAIGRCTTCNELQGKNIALYIAKARVKEAEALQVLKNQQNSSDHTVKSWIEACNKSSGVYIEACKYYNKAMDACYAKCKEYKPYSEELYDLVDIMTKKVDACPVVKWKYKGYDNRIVDEYFDMVTVYTDTSVAKVFNDFLTDKELWEYFKTNAGIE